MMLKHSLLFCLVIFFLSCKETTKPIKTDAIGEELTLKYAKGFEVIDYGSYQILKINQPWPKAEKSYEYALIPEENVAAITLNVDDFDGIITTPVKKIVVTSTTHIPALKLLGMEQTLIGFPGMDYISSENIRTRIDQGQIRELGTNEGINTEVLLELQPDVVIGFGIDGTSKSFETIKKSNIPVIYNGDWIETSPLAKAEWIKFFGVLFNKEKEADIVFNQIEKEYLEAKKLAANVTTKPTVLSGAMHKDVWYLPSGTSPEAQLLADANVDYRWKETTANGSLALSFESVFEKGKTADLWLSPSNFTSLEAIEKANQHYTKFEAFQNKNVYSFTNTTGATGGVLYYELGMARPDLVLKDIIKICHPNLLENYEPFFFKKLE
jgi:iron complex transport system substrate-binding protein